MAARGDSFMKLYDFDGMFEEKLADYIKRNPKGYTEKQWEDVIPVMYGKFGDTVIKSIGQTPNEFYAGQTDEQLVSSLRAQLNQGVPVSEFLCNAIESRHMEELLLPLLRGSDDEIAYALNLIGPCRAALPEYMRLIVQSDSEDVCNTCVDNVKEFADDVKDEALQNYKNGVKHRAQRRGVQHSPRRLPHRRRRRARAPGKLPRRLRRRASPALPLRKDRGRRHILRRLSGAEICHRSPRRYIRKRARFFLRSIL